MPSCRSIRSIGSRRSSIECRSPVCMVIAPSNSRLRLQGCGLRRNNAMSRWRVSVRFARIAPIYSSIRSPEKTVMASVLMDQDGRKNQPSL